MAVPDPPGLSGRAHALHVLAVVLSGGLCAPIYALEWLRTRFGRRGLRFALGLASAACLACAASVASYESPPPEERARIERERAAREAQTKAGRTTEQRAGAGNASQATARTRSTVSAGAGAARLRSGYVICESGGQLRWFIGVHDFSELWEPHPDDWKMPINTSSAEARKALHRVWCSTTDGMEFFAVELLENCDKHLPYPNGGCRKVRLRPANSNHSTTWYTFGDAVIR